MKRKTWLYAIVALIVVGGGYMYFGGSEKEEKTTVERTAKVWRENIRSVIQANGKARPQNRLVLKPPVSGRVEKILVEEGDSVRKGQILAWLSSTERAALLDAARSEGQAELERWEKLYKAAPMIAPISGTVISRGVEPGQTVSTGDSVLVLSDHLIIRAQLDETDIGKIKLGMMCNIVLDAYPDVHAEGKVDHVAFEARTVSNVTIYDVEVLPNKVPDVMRSGMTATVEFVIAQRKGVLLLPVEAVTYRKGKAWVVRAGGEEGSDPDYQELELGMSDGKKIEIISGLEEGDEVVYRGLAYGGEADGTSSASGSSKRGAWRAARRMSK